MEDSKTKSQQQQQPKLVCWHRSKKKWSDYKFKSNLQTLNKFDSLTGREQAFEMKESESRMNSVKLQVKVAQTKQYSCACHLSLSAYYLAQYKIKDGIYEASM